MKIEVIFLEDFAELKVEYIKNTKRIIAAIKMNDNLTIFLSLSGHKAQTNGSD